MRDAMLNIKELHVSVEDKEILKGLSLTVNPGEIHVLMGPNGAGKSTLVSAVMGHSKYAVTGGEIRFEGRDVTGESADKRARAGIFMSFQAPEEIPGVTMSGFLRTAMGAVEGRPPKALGFMKDLNAAMDELDMDHAYAERYLNVGFSGGEKKKAEILQLLLLKPKLAMLDETDSGLDVDAVRTVSKGVKAFHSDKNALIIITHNAKILEDLPVTHVHVLENGVIVKNGGPELVAQITEDGFGGLAKEG